MLLQSKDEFDALMELDAITGSHRILSRKQHPEITNTPVAGGYSVVDTIPACLYRRDNALYFRLGEDECQITDDVESVLAREDGYSLFQLVRNGKLLVDFKYRSSPPEVPLRIDPTPFIEEEDFDFLLFVHNVLEQADRRHRVYNE